MIEVEEGFLEVKLTNVYYIIYKHTFLKNDIRISDSEA